MSLNNLNSSTVRLNTNEIQEHETILNNNTVRLNTNEIQEFAKLDNNTVRLNTNDIQELGNLTCFSTLDFR